MPKRRDEHEPGGVVVIRLDTPEELFAVDPRSLLAGSRRLDSGVEELVDRFLAMKKKIRTRRIVLELAGPCPASWPRASKDLSVVTASCGSSGRNGRAR